MAIEERVYVVDAREKGKLTKILGEEPYAQISFARVAPQLKEEEGKIYIYINADASFFEFAEEKFRQLETAKRTEKAKEAEMIKKIKEESDAAAAGFGGVFGE